MCRYWNPGCRRVLQKPLLVLQPRFERWRRLRNRRKAGDPQRAGSAIYSRRHGPPGWPKLWTGARHGGGACGICYVIPAGSCTRLCLVSSRRQLTAACYSSQVAILPCAAAAGPGRRLRRAAASGRLAGDRVEGGWPAAGGGLPGDRVPGGADRARGAPPPACPPLAPVPPPPPLFWRRPLVLSPHTHKLTSSAPALRPSF
jgi:hypothetical protein